MEAVAVEETAFRFHCWHQYEWCRFRLCLGFGFGLCDCVASTW
jgi:hypothetical protein